MAAGAVEWGNPMDLFSSLALFVLGIGILVKGAQALVRGAISVARLFGISTWFIGTVIVGAGTSIPELSINVAAALEGTAVGVSTIIGDNTFNMLFILGLAAFIAPFSIERAWLRDFFVNALAIAAAALFIALPLLGPPGFGGISTLEGLALLGCFAGWALLALARKTPPNVGVDRTVLAGFSAFVFVLAGLLGVFFGGMWVVDGAQKLAAALGVSSALIGLTIVAIGTSLPELTVSLVAAFRKTNGIAIGNILGSSVFDFFGILGLSALIRPLAVPEAFRFDIFVAFAAAATLLAALLLRPKLTLTRGKGLALVLFYAVLFAVLVARG